MRAFMADKIKIEAGKQIEFFASGHLHRGRVSNDPIGLRIYPPLMAAHGGDLYPAFQHNMRDCGVADIVKPLRMLSVEAAKQFADESLDFLFIDASHDYESVRADLHAWLPKIKAGGTVAGHDTDFPGVLDAVRDVFGNHFSIVGKRCWLTRKDKSQATKIPTVLLFHRLMDRVALSGLNAGQASQPDRGAGKG